MGAEPRRVRVFFYGTFMSPGVLAEHGVVGGEAWPARVSGFELTIRPRVNLAASDRSCVFGALVALTHEDLARIYSDLVVRFGLTYLPVAVLAETSGGGLIPALCHVVPEMPAGPADPDT